MSSPSDVTDPLLLQNQLCHSLYSASNAVVRAYRPLLEPLGLTYPQYLVMLALWEVDEVAIKHLVTKTRLDSGSLTPILKRLEQKGLVQRRKSEQDERQWLMCLTPAGSDLRKQAEDIPHRLWCMADMELAEARALKAAAEQLYRQISEREGEPGGHGMP